MASRREQAGLQLTRPLHWYTLQAMQKMSLPATNQEIDSAVAGLLKLTPAQCAVMRSDGRQTELAYRVAWARSVLRVAGAVDRVAPGLWTLTEEGWGISSELVEKRYKQHLADKRAGQPDDSEEDHDGKDDSPDDESAWSDALLDRLKQVSPAGFEHLSAALLRAAGFDDVEITGRSGDGGIDGIGIYRPSGLISFHTAFQCKRYPGSVGAGSVRDFRGSFVGRAERGIMLTTGHFTRDARDEATRAGANHVDLIDGETFCELLREHSLGVRTTQRVVEDITIDDAYFDQFEDT